MTNLSDEITQLENGDTIAKLEQSRISEIAQLHSEIVGYIKITLENAIRIGELLTEQKAELKHGEWIPWIEGSLPFDKRTAQRYMKCYLEKEELKNDNVSHLSAAYIRCRAWMSYTGKQSRLRPCGEVVGS